MINNNATKSNNNKKKSLNGQATDRISIESYFAKLKFSYFLFYSFFVFGFFFFGAVYNASRGSTNFCVALKILTLNFWLWVIFPTKGRQQENIWHMSRIINHKTKLPCAQPKRLLLSREVENSLYTLHFGCTNFVMNLAWELDR